LKTCKKYMHRQHPSICLII